MKTKTDKSKSTEVKPNAKEDLKSIPLAEVEKNWNPHLTVLPKPRRRNGKPNTDLTKLKKKNKSVVVPSE